MTCLDLNKRSDLAPKGEVSTVAGEHETNSGLRVRVVLCGGMWEKGEFKYQRDTGREDDMSTNHMVGRRRSKTGK